MHTLRQLSNAWSIMICSLIGQNVTTMVQTILCVGFLMEGIIIGLRITRVFIYFH